MPNDNRRLLLEINNAVAEVNRRTINPVLQQLNLEQLKPMIEMVAQSRADYLQCFFGLTNQEKKDASDQSHIKRLAGLRLRYEELLKAMQALETAIEREYIDVSRK